jgi:hypothetical protein
MAAERIPIEDASDLVLLVLHANEHELRRPLQSATRLQKLLFLLTESPEYRALWTEKDGPLHFRPYKMGPFTAEIYEGLEVLGTFQPALVEATPSGKAGSEDVEVAEYADEIDLDDPSSRSDEYVYPAEYRLTSDGKQVAQRLWDDAPEMLRGRIESIVRKYGRLSLRELLRTVYADYPTMTIRSEIREQLGTPFR